MHGRFGPYLTDAYRTPWGDAVNVAGPAATTSAGRSSRAPAGGSRTSTSTACASTPSSRSSTRPPPRSSRSSTDAVHAAGRAAGRTGARDRRELGQRSAARAAAAPRRHRLRRRVERRRAPRPARRPHRRPARLLRRLRRRRRPRRGARPSVGVQRPATRSTAAAATAGPSTTCRRALRRVHPNHDHVGNTPAGARPPFDHRRRLVAAATVLLSPFTPMLFMGEEYAETAPFPFFVDHGDPELLEATRRGRREEFAAAEWSEEVPIPADPATFAAAVLDPSLADVAPHRASWPPTPSCWRCAGGTGDPRLRRRAARRRQRRSHRPRAPDAAMIAVLAVNLGDDRRRISTVDAGCPSPSTRPASGGRRRRRRARRRAVAATAPHGRTARHRLSGAATCGGR